MKTKINFRSAILFILAVIMLISVISCGETIDKEGLWENATYRKDMEFGSGAKTVTVEVKVGENAVNFTIHTDKSTVGEALFEHELITGDQGQYGLYIKTVNGILADYDIDKSYWAFYVNGDYALTGVDTTEIDETAKYQLVYTKE